MMKQILLRVAPVFAKMAFGKFAQPRRVQFSCPWKIVLSQNALNPDIDGKSAQPFIGEKHHTISDLCTHAWQFTELLPKIGIGKYLPLIEIHFARINKPGGGEQMRRAIADRAFAQFPF